MPSISQTQLRLVGVAIALTLAFLITLGGAQTAAAQGEPVLVPLTSLNVRSGPGTTYPVIGSLVRGVPVAILQTAAECNWYKTAAGGWSSGGAAYSTVIGDASALPASDMSCRNPAVPAPARSTAALAPTPASAASGTCNPIVITDMIDRPAATVNGTPVRLQVRDVNNCVRGLFRNETGVAAGSNFTLDLPEGWAAISASVSVAVHREGGTQQDYLNCPIVFVRGPWKGGLGVYEGAFDVVPIEWLEERLAQIQPIQSVECGRTITPVEHR